MKNGKKWLAFVAACMSLVAAVLVAGCKPEQQYAVGNFYSLEEAYENGWLTQEDILSIAYYYNQGAEGNEALMGESLAGRRRHGKKCTIVKIISHWQRRTPLLFDCLSWGGYGIMKPKKLQEKCSYG